MNITGRKMPQAPIGYINGIYWANVWTGTKRSSMTELIDEFGETYNFTEFANKIGVKKMRPVTGFKGVSPDFYPNFENPDFLNR